MYLAIMGNDFNFFSSTNKPKIELVGRQWTQKSTLSAKGEYTVCGSTLVAVNIPKSRPFNQSTSNWNIVRPAKKNMNIFDIFLPKSQ